MDETIADPRHRFFFWLVPIIFCGILLLPFGYGLLFVRSATPDPRPIFEHETGLAWPNDATIVSSGDFHGGFVGDGEFYVVLHVDDATVLELIESQPGKPLSNWQAGPVPTEIGYHCAFGTSGVTASSVNSGPTQYSGSPELVSVLSSNEILYSAHERCCDGSLEWHNGTLLILDPEENKIWLSVWDF